MLKTFLFQWKGEEGAICRGGRRDCYVCSSNHTVMRWSPLWHVSSSVACAALACHWVCPKECGQQVAETVKTAFESLNVSYFYFKKFCNRKTIKCFRGQRAGIMTSIHKMSFGGTVILYSAQYSRYAFLIHITLRARYWRPRTKIKLLLRFHNLLISTYKTNMSLKRAPSR